ncbi:MAG TPA: oligosaccharide flippase family protein [Caulobacteraceae bacterium]|nr:oligosaccharide flippase family protein [Caulobacteraceae bacterium]
MSRPSERGAIAGRAALSAAWVVASRLGARSIDFVTLLVLTRALTPKDFGLVAIAMTLVQIMEAIFELPISQVLVRSEALTPPMMHTAFTMGAARGAALALILGAAAWPFARLYNDDRLIPLIMFLSLAPAMRGIASPAMAHFWRNLNFRPDAIIEISAKILAGVIAAGLGLFTHSYWAIASATVLGPMFMAMGSYMFAPSAVRLSLVEWRAFAGFMGWTTAAQVLVALNWQADRLIVARFVPRAELGLFSMASDLSGLPEQALLKPIYQPTFSAFALVRNDRARLGDAYQNTAAAVFSVGLPLMLGLGLLAHPAVQVVLGAKWMEASNYLQWMALLLIMPLLNAPVTPLAMVEGRSDIFMRINLCELVIKIPATLVGVWYMGPMGVIIARTVSAAIMVLVSMGFVRMLAGVPILRQLKRPSRPLIAGTAMAGALVLLRAYLLPLSGVALTAGLAACSLAGLLIYVAVLAGLWLASGRPPGFESWLLERASGILARRTAKAA